MNMGCGPDPFVCWSSLLANPVEHGRYEVCGSTERSCLPRSVPYWRNFLSRSCHRLVKWLLIPGTRKTKRHHQYGRCNLANADKRPLRYHLIACCNPRLLSHFTFPACPINNTTGACSVKSWALDISPSRDQVFSLLMLPLPSTHTESFIAEAYEVRWRIGCLTYMYVSDLHSLTGALEARTRDMHLKP